ncbi:MAG TPA: APC family permease [Bryobacteraceae bacterium]|nr:APC family permease [Bryobacteraceae bacterium]
MSLLDLLIGRPLSTREERGQRIAVAAGVAVFGLDALSSAAYGPEAALTVLRPLGNLGAHYIVPLSLGIIVLLTIVFFSYRQTIEAYPAGGGSFTVARENLGNFPGLLAGSALMIDYILNVAVGISAGVGAMISAMPSLQPHTLKLCLAILVIITLVNLRGLREAGLVFLAPTYLFVGSLAVMIVLGAVKTVLAGGAPTALVAPPPFAPVTVGVGAWLMLKAFSSGCTALTGVEAVSNGVSAFEEPAVDTARRTLAAIIAILILLLGGIAWLAQIYHIGATDPGDPGYQSMLSQLLAAVVGRGPFYFVAITSIVLVLVFSANTSFADFPRLCNVIAETGYLPRSFGTRGRRLVFSIGIVVLALIAGLLLTVFGGVTDRLIPLFAIGAFLAFTLSQAGMVVHWKRVGGAHARHSMIINGIGATATGLTLVVILCAKFLEGAWITILLMPLLLGAMIWVRRHYDAVSRQIEAMPEFDPGKPNPPMVVLPVQRWNKIADKALRFSMNLSAEVRAVHIECAETKAMVQQWQVHVARPARELGLQEPELVVLESPFRFVVATIVNYSLELAQKNPDNIVAVVIPELVESRWYHYLLHNQRASLLKAMLLVKGNERVVVVNVPWYLQNGH